MPITIKYKAPSAEAPPVPKEYTILDALAEKADGRIGELRIVHKEKGHMLLVVDYNKSTGETRLITDAGSRLHPRVGPREAKLYYPLWRD